MGSRRDATGGLDFLLIMCPPWDITRPPINLALLASFLKSKNYKTDAWDLNIKFYNAVIETPLKDLWDMMSQNTVTPQEMTDRFFADAPELVDKFVDQILETGAKFIGFSIHYRNIVFTEHMVAKLRQRNKKVNIIYGGPEAIAAYKIGQLGNLHADAYVMGEGEATLEETLKSFEINKKFVQLEGLVVPVKGNAVSEFEPRKPILDLDTLPFPTYEEFDLNEYHPEDNNVNLPFLFSRGCIGKCTFCMDHFIAGRHRCRSAENAVAEIKYHIKRYGITHFGFNDLICNGSPKALERLCEVMIQENLNILWWSYAVIRRGLTAELFKKMRASGCVSVNFGMESASTKVLKMMNKYYTQEIAEETIRNCARAGIQTAINIIVGFPGETRKEHQETMEFLKRNKDYLHTVVNLGTLMLSPGTKISTFPEDFGVKIDEVRGTWYSDDGNNIDERNRRLEEVRYLLHQLNIPLVIINREMCAGDENPVPDYPMAEAPRTTPDMKVTDVKFYNGMDQECIEYNTGDLMTIAMRYEVVKPVTDPLIRVQIYNDENPISDNVFVHGTNTDRFNIKLGELAVGAGEARIIFYRLNQLPGHYRVTIGLWADEMAPVPYDVQHGAYQFIIIGEADPSGATAHIPYQWSQGEKLEAVGNGTTSLNSLQLVDKDGISKPCYMTQEQLKLHIDCEVADPDKVKLVTTILLKGGVVHRAVHDKSLPKGRNYLDLTYSPINLLEGGYETVVMLEDIETGKELSVQRGYFDVRSRRIEGAGLVFNPSAWNIIKVPR